VADYLRHLMQLRSHVRAVDVLHYCAERPQGGVHSKVACRSARNLCDEKKLKPCRGRHREGVKSPVALVSSIQNMFCLTPLKCHNCWVSLTGAQRVGT
jgi:hypothetical protein